MELLEQIMVLRRQTLYPTELRAHPWLLFDSTALAILIRVPTLRRFLEHLEQVHQIQRQRSPLKAYATDRIAFIHDSIKFNRVFLDTFEGLKRDLGIACRDRLVSIELKSWQEEVLLQAAD